MKFQNVHLLFLWFLALVRLSHQQNEFVREVSQNFHPKLSSKLEQHIQSYHNQELAYRSYASFYDRADVNLPGFKKFFKSLSERAMENALAVTRLINERGGHIHFSVVKLTNACEDIEKAYQAHEVTSRTKSNICSFLLLRNPYAVGKKKEKTPSLPNSWWSYLDNTETEKTYTEWQNLSGLQGLEDALALEKSINAGLLELVNNAKTHRDPHIKFHMEDFLEKQAETIKEVADLITRLRQYQVDNDYALGEFLLDKSLQS